MRGLVLFLLGILIGAYAFHVYERRGSGRWHRSDRSAEQRHGTATNLGNDISERLRRWHLSGDDIREDLARTGEIVRSRAAVAGAKLTDARILAVIKAKYVLDRDLSARDIQVDVHGGSVTLVGTVASNDLVGKAMALALDTDGVGKVTSRLVVAPKS